MTQITPQTHKMAIINQAIHRLLHIPLTAEAIQAEIQIIQQIAVRNGLNVNIPTMVRRRRLRQLLSQTANLHINTNPQAHNHQDRWIRLPFLGNHSYKISRELRRFNYRAGFYPLTTVGQLFNRKDPIPVNKKSGVYKLKCGKCEVQYVGQTGCSFSTAHFQHVWEITAIHLTKISLQSFLYG